MHRNLKLVILTFILLSHVHAEGGARQTKLTFRIADTGVEQFYDNTSIIPKPKRGESFFGRDAQYRIIPPSYSDNGDGTITDNVTGLMWQKADSGRGMDWEMALKYAENMTLGEHEDWRLPSAKELQSIVDYSRSPQTSDSAAIDPVKPRRSKTQREISSIPIIGQARRISMGAIPTTQLSTSPLEQPKETCMVA